MDHRTRRDLDRLLGDLEHERQEERQRERQERIRQAEHSYRFEAVKREAIRPALKEIQARLERRGDLTRLHEPRASRVRLELLMQAATPVRGTLEVELDASGELVLRARRQHVPVGEHRLALEAASRAQIAAVAVELLRAIAGASLEAGASPAGP